MKRTLLKAFTLALLIPLALLAAELLQATFTLKHRDARSVVARISEELSERGSIAVEGEGNRILVRDTGAVLDRIDLLVRELDRPAARFALSTRLDLFPLERENPLFGDQPGFVDMTHWMKQTRPQTSFEAHLNVEEGGKAEGRFGTEYGLSIWAAGYDPTRDRLGLKRLELWRSRESEREILISGGASLPEGKLTSVIIGASESHPPLRLHLNPTLLPTLDDSEVPR